MSVYQLGLENSFKGRDVGVWFYAQQRNSNIAAYTYSRSFFGKLIHIHKGEQLGCVNEEHTKNIYQA